jgi:hypothetical protein
MSGKEAHQCWWFAVRQLAYLRLLMMGNEGEDVQLQNQHAMLRLLSCILLV